MSTIYNGYFSDASRMFCIGNVSEENKKLVEITRQAVYLGLEQVKPWGHLGDIGQVINDLARANGYKVVTIVITVLLFVYGILRDKSGKVKLHSHEVYKPDVE